MQRGKYGGGEPLPLFLCGYLVRTWTVKDRTEREVKESTYRATNRKKSSFDRCSENLKATKKLLFP